MKPAAKLILEVLPFCLGCLFGWMVWAESPAVTGEIEPWDSPMLYYSPALFLAGVVASPFGKYGLLTASFGIATGQLSYIVAEHGTLWMLVPGALSIALFGTIQTVLGAIPSWALGMSLRYAFSHPPAR